MDKEMKDIIIKLEDHENRIFVLEGGKSLAGQPKKTNWFKPGSTTAKILDLINEGFFKKPKSISEIISEFKTKDYHLKPSDLTMSLRVVVRKGLLKKTKDMPDGSKSKKWMYIKI